jgi:hypothetical protein
MVRRLGGLVALCLLGACGGDSSPTGGGTPDGNGNPPDNEGNGNSGPIFEENSTSLEVVAVEAPDTLHSGSQPVLFAATVQDSAQFTEQIEVAMRVGQGGEVRTLLLQDSLSSNTALFGAMFDSTLAAGFSGTQTLQFQAAGAEASGSKTLTKEIYLKNEPPVLFEPDTPDTLQRLTGARIQLYISASDPQGYGDIDSVYFKFRKPDGSFGGASEKEGGFHFVLVDNGIWRHHGDEKEGDGRFAFNFSIVENALLGTYTVIFFSRDKVGNLSGIIQADFELVPLPDLKND